MPERPISASDPFARAFDSAYLVAVDVEADGTTWFSDPELQSNTRGGERWRVPAYQLTHVEVGKKRIAATDLPLSTPQRLPAGTYHYKKWDLLDPASSTLLERAFTEKPHARLDSDDKPLNGAWISAAFARQAKSIGHLVYTAERFATWAAATAALPYDVQGAVDAFMDRSIVLAGEDEQPGTALLKAAGLVAAALRRDDSSRHSSQYISSALSRYLGGLLIYDPDNPRQGRQAPEWAQTLRVPMTELFDRAHLLPGKFWFRYGLVGKAGAIVPGVLPILHGRLIASRADPTALTEVVASPRQVVGDYIVALLKRYRQESWRHPPNVQRTLNHMAVPGGLSLERLVDGATETMAKLRPGVHFHPSMPLLPLYRENPGDFSVALFLLLHFTRRTDAPQEEIGRMFREDFMHTESSYITYGGHAQAFRERALAIMAMQRPDLTQAQLLRKRKANQKLRIALSDILAFSHSFEGGML